MSKFQALLIKYWRVRCDGTWNWVAGYRDWETYSSDKIGRAHV